MTVNKITFLNYRPDRFSEENSPIPIIKTLPDWYKDMPKYIEVEYNSQTIKGSTAKNCVPFFDAMSSGYVFVTPCDIRFYEVDGMPYAEVLDKKYEDFVGPRHPMEHFPKNEGYHEHHFHWLVDWGTKLPDGYSALYVSPLNMYQLPFLTTSGIVDNDKTSIYGQFPFFVKKGINTIIPKGTPYVQIIPIKRDEWHSEVVVLTQDQVVKIQQEAVRKYREVESNGYRKLEWSRKHYE